MSSFDQDLNTGQVAPSYNFLEGGGEMGELIRSIDWSKTPIESPSKWPQSLRTSVNNMLNSYFPMYIAWGKDYIQIYNDGYRPILGSTKHPQAMGISTRETFAEIWHIIGTMFEGVMNGEAVGFPNFMLHLDRNGYIEECYFDFCYSPIKLKDGTVGGILVTVIETTQKVKAYNELNETKQELEIARAEAESQRDQLKESAKNFMLLADNIPQLTWMADETGWIFWYNQRWYDYTGTTLEEMQGWGWKKVQHPDHIEEVVQRWSAYLKMGEIWEDTFPLKSKEGGYRWFLSRATPVKDESGKVGRWFGTNTDITEQRILEQQKDEFISIASHELKTPMTTLKATMQVLDRLIITNPQSEKISQFIGKANGSIKKMQYLVEDLMNVSKIQAGQMMLNKTTFKLSDLLNECRSTIELRGTHEINIDGDTGIEIFADYPRLEQVINNLVNNAIKYAPDSKKIIINIEKQNPTAKISVQDFGIGISDEKLPHLFKRYYRVDSSGIQFSGLGLGLYICADIIERHGGEIGVKSERGKGSTFWFTIPAKIN